uniref:Uncharacterized protein n=1 Tax=Aegilops tauschii subsp. strangulata TaxID=200361 RepID=A0A453SW37_AEGTS
GEIAWGRLRCRRKDHHRLLGPSTPSLEGGTGTAAARRWNLRPDGGTPPPLELKARHHRGCKEPSSAPSVVRRPRAPARCPCHRGARTVGGRGRATRRESRGPWSCLGLSMVRNWEIDYSCPDFKSVELNGRWFGVSIIQSDDQFPFGCTHGQSSMRYLGILIHYRRLTIAEWKHVEKRLEKRLSSWSSH